MDKPEMVKRLSAKLGLDEKEGEVIVNEILAIQVVPNFFRKTAVERIASVSAIDKVKAEMAVNEFVGSVTASPALFEEVVRGFSTAAVTNGCDRCRDCFNCGSEALSLLAAVELPSAGR